MTKGTASATVTPDKLSTYYHYEMLADNFRCTDYYKAPTGSSTSNPSTLKAFGAYKQNSKLIVVLMNQESRLPTVPAAKTCTLRLDATNATGTYWFKMSFPGTITIPQHIVTLEASSTVVLVFDGAGNLSRKIEYKQSSGSTGKPVYTTYNSNVLMTELGDNYTHPSGCSTTLTSNPNISGATYTWYYSGDNFATAQAGGWGNQIGFIVTDTWIWKVVVSQNGCSAYDYITVTEGSACGGGDGPLRLAAPGSADPLPVSELLNNVPNPTTGNTTINYKLAPGITNAQIRITDIRGNSVDVLPISSENTTVEFNCKNCADGIYFYSLFISDKLIATKKMIIAE